MNATPIFPLLVKFYSKRKYAEQFRRGTLFFRPLGEFREMTEVGRSDKHEGAGSLLSGGVVWINDAGPLRCHALSFHYPETDSLSAFCLAMFRSIPGKTGPEVKASLLNDVRDSLFRFEEEMGTHAVVIWDFEEFCQRIQAAVPDLYGGLVGYADHYEFLPAGEAHAHRHPQDAWFRELPGSIQAAYMKRTMYAWQREWRVASRAVSNQTIDVGSLEDIVSETVPTAGLVAYLQSAGPALDQIESVEKST